MNLFEFVSIPGVCVALDKLKFMTNLLSISIVDLTECVH